MSAATTECTFDGTASTVHIVGIGAALLIEDEPLSNGAAHRVELQTAQIGGYPQNRIENPGLLTPLNLNGDDKPYDITYEIPSSRSLEIRVVAGGEVGHYEGGSTLADCSGPRGCDVVWSYGTKLIRVQRAKDDACVLTGEFPFGELDFSPTSSQPHVSRVELDDAIGDLRCREAEKPITKARLDFASGARSVQAIKVEDGRFKVSIASDVAPMVPWHWTGIGLGVSTAVAAVAVGLILWQRRNRVADVPIDCRSDSTEAPVDLFISYNRADLAEVEEIAHLATTQGYSVFLDAWNIKPGDPFVPVLEQSIASASNLAIFIGKHGVGPWQNFEIRAVLAQLAERNCRVIPVILPSAPKDLRLTPFLSTLHRVDLRESRSEALRTLWKTIVRLTPLAGEGVKGPSVAPPDHE